MSIGADAEADAALLDSFHGVLDLEKLALRGEGGAVGIVESLKH